MLHLIRSEPDAPTEDLIEAMRLEDRDCVLRLYEENPDWDLIVRSIFEHDKIICWW